MKPLSVGNVVSAGLRIYRDNFKKYFWLAFVGYLWFYIPIVIVGAVGGVFKLGFWQQFRHSWLLCIVSGYGYSSLGLWLGKILINIWVNSSSCL